MIAGVRGYTALRPSMEDYIEASNGLPDPTALNQMQTNIVRLQAAIGDLPTEAPGEAEFFGAVAQTIMGNYYDAPTNLGTVMQAAISAIPHPAVQVLDFAADVRDIVYDFTREDASKINTFFDVLGFAPGALDTLKYFKYADAVGPLVKSLLALLPAAEVLKYLDEVSLLGKNARRVDDLAESVDELSDTARAAQRLTETGEVVEEIVKIAGRSAGGAGEVVDSIDELEYNNRNDLGVRDMEGLWRARISELPSEIDELYMRGWREVTPTPMAENSTSRLFFDDKSGLTIRFDEGTIDGVGYGKVDHYHVFNPNSTGKGDYYLDCYGNPVPKNSKASHIIP